MSTANTHNCPLPKEKMLVGSMFTCPVCLTVWVAEGFFDRKWYRTDTVGGHVDGTTSNGYDQSNQRWFDKFLLRFRWRHQQLGCAEHIGISVTGEDMWVCRIHDRAAL